MTTMPQIQPSSPSLEVQFKHGMRRLAAGVSLIATRHDGQTHGLIVTSVSSVTVDPPTLLVCVNHSASAHDAIAAAGVFSVNVLAPNATDIAAAFSDPKRRDERFQVGCWSTGQTLAPILDDALVAFECTIATSLNYATHTIFLGKVVSVTTSAKQHTPLVYFESKFQTLDISAR